MNLGTIMMDVSGLTFSAAPRNNTLNTPNLIAIKPPKNPPAMVMNRPNVLATVAISILRQVK
jgi:hypothetical protein